MQKALQRLEVIEAAKQPKTPAKQPTRPAEKPVQNPDSPSVQPSQGKKGKKGKSGKRQRQPRASTTDAEARIMKMADGGFRPAYDVQFATDTLTQVIVGVEVSNQGNDKGQLGRMLAQLKQRYGFYPPEALVDPGFEDHDDFDRAAQLGVRVYCPPSEYAGMQDGPYAPQPRDSRDTMAWRERMASDEAKAIYKQRAATAECVNALAANRGLRAFVVRGLEKVRAVAIWYALLHTLLRGRALRLAAAQA